MQESFGEKLVKLDIAGFRSGSVLVDVETTLVTGKTREEDVDAQGLAANTTATMKQIVEEEGVTFDPEAVETSEEIEVIVPATAPAPTG